MIKFNIDFRSFHKLGILSNTDLQHRKQLLNDALTKFGESTSDDSNPINRIIDVKIRNLIGVKISVFFLIPAHLADYIISEYADLHDNLTILEPSAGKGDPAAAIRRLSEEQQYKINLELVEQSAALREILKLKYYAIAGSNFLEFTEKYYVRIIMNPPFEGGQDMHHVYHAFELLNKDGILISNVSRCVFFRSYKKVSDFRELVSKYGYSIELPAISFSGSQSFSQVAVNTNLVIFFEVKKVLNFNCKPR